MKSPNHKENAAIDATMGGILSVEGIGKARAEAIIRTLEAEELMEYE